LTEQEAQRISKMIKDNNIQIIDLKFNDLPGLWQHFSITPRQMSDVDDLQNSIWVDGIGFDGSSIRGFQMIQESDMILIPDPSTARIDPVMKIPTLSVICDIKDPLSKQPYTRDPRYVARKAEEYVKSSNITDADTAFFGPELEFFVFDDIRFDQTENSGYYYVDSVEGEWNTGREENPNLGYKPRFKEGYFPVPPHDSLQDIRSEMILEMEKVGMTIEVHHHEVATAGQCEIDMRFDTLLTTADQVLWYKYIVKNVARRHNKVATFMPSRSSATTALACTRTSRSGRTASHSSTTRTATPARASFAAGTLAVFSSTAAHSWRSARRRRTPTSAWFPATRHL